MHILQLEDHIMINLEQFSGQKTTRTVAGVTTSLTDEQVEMIRQRLQAGERRRRAGGPGLRGHVPPGDAPARHERPLRGGRARPLRGSRPGE